MKNGFTYKGKHSSDFGITVKTKERSLLPEVKSYFYDVPLMDGKYDMSDCNIYNRTFYNDRIFEVIMGISANNLYELEHIATKIAIWLTGKGKFKFDDMSAEYDARVISNIPFTPERGGKSAKLSVIFQCSAIASAKFNTYDGISLNDDIALDSDIPLDMSQYFSLQLAYGENSVNFVNIGDYYIKPVFIFIGDMTSIAINYENHRLIVENISSECTIDFEKCTITSNGENIINNMQGDFWEFPPGLSDISVYSNAECMLGIKYIPKTIYDFDFDYIDWGDSNA